MASFSRAKEIFDDNNRYVSPQDNPVDWNLSNGLSALALALESDLSKIKSDLGHIMNQIQRLK